MHGTAGKKASINYAILQSILLRKNCYPSFRTFVHVRARYPFSFICVRFFFACLFVECTSCKKCTLNNNNNKMLMIKKKIIIIIIICKCVSKSCFNDLA